MIDAVGPVFTGGFEAITAGEGDERYAILYLPDKHNDDLQQAGKPPVYYWMPNYVRLARRGDTGDYKFHLIHFVGVQSGETTVGVEGKREVAGGVLSLTTTSAFPASVLQRAQEALLERFRGKDLRYWGWRSPAAPMFRPMPIVASMTALTNLSPRADGSIAPAGAAPAPGPEGGGRGILQPRFADMPRTVPHGRAFRAPSNLDAWYWDLQGNGPSSIIPTGENAFSGLLGSLPTAILWQGFHGTYSPVSVAQALKLKVWSQTLKLKIEGNWDRVFEHFSAAAAGRYWWFSADIQAEFNKLVISGGIKVELEIDGTLPTADKLREEISKRTDLIVAKFLDQAQKRIFEPAPPNVTPAQASTGGGLLSGLFGFGGGFSLKYRRDETQLNLRYDETRSEQYLQSHHISSTLEGFYDEIKQDPAAERKYFTTLYLDDWDRKVTRIVKPVVNWPDPAKKWVGEPVSFLSVQVGYPSTRGDIQWTAHVFQSTDTEATTRWEPSFAKKDAADVAAAPDGWTPDKTFIKRRVHFTEPPGETDSPYMRVFVEKNVVDLDPTETGTLTSDNTIEVRADTVGKLEVGPLSLNVDLDNPNQVVEVDFQAFGKTDEGNDRPIITFRWTYADQAEPRYWEIFTGQLNFVPRYKYRARVIVKGSLFTKGMQWEGQWQERGGNGPCMVLVPTPEDEGVVVRRLVPGVEARPPAPEVPAPAPAPTMPPPPPPGMEVPAVPPPRATGAGGPPPPGGAERAGMPARMGPPPGRREAERMTRTAPPTQPSGVMEPLGDGFRGQELQLVSGWTAAEPRHS